MTLGSAVTVTSNLTITAGTLATANNAITLNGNFSNSGTFTAGSSAITVSNAAAQSIDGFTTTGLVSMRKTGGTATLNGNVSGGALTINGTGGALNLGTDLTHTFTGTWTRTAGTLNGGSSTLRLGAGYSGTGGVFSNGTGTVEWNRAGLRWWRLSPTTTSFFPAAGPRPCRLGTAVSNNLSMTGTALANLTAGINIPVNNLTLGGVNKVSGTWGSSSSAATHTNNTYFSATSGF